MKNFMHNYVKKSNKFAKVNLREAENNLLKMWMHYNYDNYKVKTCALLISFQCGTSDERRTLKERT